MVVESSSLLLLNEEVDEILALRAICLSCEKEIVLVGSHAVGPDYVLDLISLERFLLDEWFSESLVDTSVAREISVTCPVQIFLLDLNVLHALGSTADCTIVDTLFDEIDWVFPGKQKIFWYLIDGTKANGINIEQVVPFIECKPSAVCTLHDGSVFDSFDRISVLIELNIILDDRIAVAHIEQLVLEIIRGVGRILQTCKQGLPVTYFPKVSWVAIMLIHLDIVDDACLRVGAREENSLLNIQVFLSVHSAEQS